LKIAICYVDDYLLVLGPCLREVGSGVDLERAGSGANVVKNSKAEHIRSVSHVLYKEWAIPTWMALKLAVTGSAESMR
jgi:hypothetical protein